VKDFLSVSRKVPPGGYAFVVAMAFRCCNCREESVEESDEVVVFRDIWELGVWGKRGWVEAAGAIAKAALDSVRGTNSRDLPFSSHCRILISHLQKPLCISTFSALDCIFVILN
jgi:hypothetical protein